MDSDSHLIIHQQIDTRGITAIDSFVINTTPYLVLGNGIDNYGDKSQGAEIYTWNEVDKVFMLTQTIFTDNLNNLHTFSLANGLGESMHQWT
jgi:hypothetical protein